MQAQFFSYQVLDQPKLDEIAPGEKCIVVYDRKPAIESSCALLCDLNAFKVSSWKGSFNPERHEVVVFQVQKFSIDVAYSFFRNTYKRVVVFTHDTEFRDRLLGKLACHTRINLLPNFTRCFHAMPQSSDLLSALALGLKNKGTALSKDVMHLHCICLCYYEFVRSSVYKFDILTRTSQNLQHSDKLLTVLSNNDIVSSIVPSIPSARGMVDRSQSVCFVFDFDETFDYSGFSECIFFVSQIEDANRKALADVVAQPQLEFCNSLLQNAGLLDFDGANALSKLFTLSSFRKHLAANEAGSLSMVIRKAMHDTAPFSFLRLKEVSCGNFLVPFVCARQLLDHALASIKDALEQSSLFVRCTLPTITFSAGGFMGREVRAEMSIPGLFEYSCTGNFYITKKEAVCDVSLKYILKLIEQKVLDGGLGVLSAALLELDSVKRLFIKAYGTTNKNEICKIRNEFASLCPAPVGVSIFERGGEVVALKRGSTEAANSLFKKRYMIDVFDQEKPCISPDRSQAADGHLHAFLHADDPAAKLERLYRKIPEGFSIQTSILALHTFSNSKTGVLCAESSKESHDLVNDFKEKVMVSYKGTRRYSEDEVRLLKLYQIIFFKLHSEVLPSRKQTFRLFYFAVPLDMNDQVDWPYLKKLHSEFLLDYVCNRACGDTLIWNPFTHEFYLYSGVVERNLEDEVNGTTFLKFFEQKYRVRLAVKKGRGMFKAYLVDQLSASIRKCLNVERTSINASGDNDQGEAANKRFKASGKHLQADCPCSLYGVSVQDPADMPRHSDFYAKIPLDCPKLFDFDSQVVSPAECCFVTPVKTSIVQEIEIFKRNYILLENLFVAHDLKQDYGLGLSLKDIVMCFTHSSENPCENYERLEFVGDCVLKFVSTNYLYLAGLPMDVIVSVKSRVVSNQSLFRRCLESGLYRFLKTSHFAPKMVQAPCIDDLGDLLKYFNAAPIFKSDNYSHGLSKSVGECEQTVKQYADMVEALIGAQYLRCGAASSAALMRRLNIIEHAAEGLGDVRDQMGAANHHTPLNFARLARIADQKSLFSNQTFKCFEYAGIVPEPDIRAVEEIIEYRFANPGNLERALVHPSCTNALGSADFQFLELIGDCTLDLFVTTLLYQNSILTTPLLLHSSKKSYVNNSSLHDFFHRAGLDKHAKFSLKEGVRSKAYSDFVEALVGSILVDLQWNCERLFEVMSRKIKAMLEECKQDVCFD